MDVSIGPLSCCCGVRGVRSVALLLLFVSGRVSLIKRRLVGLSITLLCLVVGCEMQLEEEEMNKKEKRRECGKQ